MRRTYWYHEECLEAVETAVRTSKSEHHELCARCGYEGLCVEAELVTNPDVRKIGVGQELKKAADALAKVALEPELTEQTEAVEDAVTGAVEAEIEVIVADDKKAVIMPVEAAIEHVVETAREHGETVIEAEPEPEIVDVIQPVIVDNKAKIEALEAELEALKK